MSSEDATSILVRFTEFPSADSKRGATEVEVPWGVFVESLQTQGFLRPETKNETPLLIPATFRPTDDGKIEKDKKHVQAVSMAVIDCDGQKKPGEKKAKGMTEEEVELLFDRIREEKLDAFVYSSYSHAAAWKKHKRSKLRVIFPLSRPVDREEWPIFWTAFNGIMASLGDPQCKDQTRGYFEPSIPKDLPKEEEELLLMHHFEGEPVEVDYVLAGAEHVSSSDQLILEHTGGDKVPRDRVKLFAKRLARSSQEYRSWMGTLMLKMLQGDVFAEDGDRDNTIYKMAQDLGEQFPNGDASSLSRMFEKSLSHMAGEDAITVEDVQAKIIRAQQKARAKEAEKTLEKQRHREDLRKKKGVTEYTAEYFEEICKRTKNGCNAKLFKKRLIIQKGNRFFVFNYGSYRCVTKDELVTTCRDLFMPAESMDVSLYNVNERGFETPKSWDQLMLEYGVVAERREMRLEAQASFFEERTQTMVEAVCPKRQLEPEESPEVTAWMLKLCGDDEQLFQKFELWLSLVPVLSRPLSMLCFVGAAGVGKTEFANGLSRLWTEGGAPPFESAFEQFNTEITRSPLLLSDEGLPKDFRGRVKTEGIRSFISRSSHGVNKKNQDVVPIIGFYRVVVAVNSIDKLKFGWAHSRDDILAIQQRLLVLEVDPDASELFDYEQFVLGDAIAKHALWLSEKRSGLEHKYERFGVSAKAGIQLLDDMALKVLEWVFAYLVARKRIEEDTKVEVPAFILKGRVYFNTNMLAESWETFFDSNAPDTRAFLQVVHIIAEEGSGIRLRMPGGFRRRYYPIDPNILYQYAMQISFDPSYLDLQLKVYTASMTTNQYVRLPKTMMPTDDEKRVREDALAQLDRIKDLDPDDDGDVDAAE